MEQTIEKLKGLARDSWRGEIGESRAVELEVYLRNKLGEYSNALEIPQEEILKSWEEDRTYSAINYYQEANQPSIKSEYVRVFETVDELRKAVEKMEFRCPNCEGISTNPSICNSGDEMSEGSTCDWKVGGLFGDLGKGIHVFSKDKMRGETIFMPVAWERVSA